jgi:hypothetical protein
MRHGTASAAPKALQIQCGLQPVMPASICDFVSDSLEFGSLFSPRVLAEKSVATTRPGV